MAKTKTGPVAETRSILVTFTTSGLGKIVRALTCTRAAYGEFLMEDSKAMSNIIVALAMKQSSIII